MSAASALPTILLAFANDRRPGAGDWLRDLVEERRELSDLLDDALAGGPLAGRFAVQLEPNLTLADLEKCVARLGPQLIGVHFGGHADPGTLRLEDRRGHPDALPADALAETLAGCPSLRWVFLNGCSTARHIEALGRTTQAAVIATTSSVRDDVARRFARAVYGALLAGRPLDAAFDAAESSVLAVRTRAALHRSGVDRGHRMLGAADGEVARDPVPWVLHRGAADPDWSLTAELSRWGLGRHLDAGRHTLPDGAAAEALVDHRHGLSPLTGAHVQPLFAALDRWADGGPEVAVCQVAGRPWSGKSRLLAAWMAQRPEPTTGFVGADVEPGWLHDVERVRHAIVVVDDADGRVDVPALLGAAAGRPKGLGRLRVVLVERDPGWLGRLRGLDDGARRLIAAAGQALVVEPALPLADREALFETLRADLATRLGRDAGPTPDLRDPCFAAPGWVLAAALCGLEGRGTGADAVARRVAELADDTRLDLELTVRADRWHARLGRLTWVIDAAPARPVEDPERQGLEEAVDDLLAASHERVVRASRLPLPAEQTHAEALTEQAAELGRRLTAALLAPAALRRLSRAVDAADSDSPATLRIRAHGDDPARIDDALAWPWELIRVDEAHPVERGWLRIVREVVDPALPDPPALDRPLTVLGAVSASSLSPIDDGVPPIGALRAVAAAVPTVHLAGLGGVEALIDEAAERRPRVVQFMATVERDLLWIEHPSGAEEGYAPESVVHGMRGRELARLPDLLIAAFSCPTDRTRTVAGEQAREGARSLMGSRRGPLAVAAALHRAGLDRVIVYHGPLDSPQSALALARMHDALAAGAAPEAAVARARQIAAYVTHEGAGRTSSLILGWLHMALFRRGPARPLVRAGETAQAWQAAADVLTESLPDPHPEPWHAPRAPLRAMAGRRIERAEAADRWRAQRVLVVQGLAGLGKSALCAELAPLLARRLGPDARIVTVDGGDADGLAAALEALASDGGPLLVHVDGLDRALHPDGRMRRPELAERWRSTLVRLTPGGARGLLASSRQLPAALEGPGVMRLRALPPAALERIMRWLPTTTRLPDADRAWLAEQVAGHPDTLRRLDLHAGIQARAVAARRLGTGEPYPGDRWRAEVLEPALSAVRAELAERVDPCSLLAALPEAARRLHAACAVLAGPVPWGAVVELADADAALRLADAGLLTPEALADGTLGWAPHALVDLPAPLDAQTRRSAHETVGRWLAREARPDAADTLGRMAAEHLLHAGLTDEAWPPLRRQVTRLRENGRPEEALTLIRRLLSAAPGPAVEARATVFRVQLETLLGRPPDDADRALDAAEAHLDADGLLFATATRANLRSRQGRWAEAKGLFERCVALADEGPASGGPALLCTLHSNLGHSLMGVGDVAGALDAFGGAIRHAQRLPEVDSAVARVHPLRESARALMLLGRNVEAIEHLQTALSLGRAVWRSDRHIEIFRCLTQLGDLAARLGDDAGAAPYLQRARRLIDRVPGAAHDPSAARCLVALAAIEAGTDRHAALVLFREAVALAGRAAGDPLVNAAEPNYHLAQCALAVGALDEAEAALTRAEAGYVRGFGADGPHRLAVGIELARVMRMRGDAAGALARFRELSATAEAGGLTGYIEPALVSWGEAALAAGDVGEALTVWRRALDRIASQGPTPEAADLLERIGRACAADGRWSTAAEAWDELVAVRTRLAGTDEDPAVVRALIESGLARHHPRGTAGPAPANAPQPERARAIFERVLRVLPALDAADRAESGAIAYARLGQLAEARGDLAAAAAHFEAALAARSALGDVDSLEMVAPLHLAVAHAEHERRRPAAAVPHWQRAAEIGEPAAPADDTCARALVGLAASLSGLGEHREARDALEQARRCTDRAAHLAEIQVALGQALLADQALVAACAELADDALPPETPPLVRARSLTIRARAQVALQDLPGAEADLRRAVELFEASTAAPSERAWAHAELGDLYCAGLGRAEDAARHLDRAEALLADAPEGPAHAFARRLRARLDLLAGRHALALAALRGVLALERGVAGSSAALAMTLQLMGEALHASGESDRAVAAAEEAVAMWIAVCHGEAHHRVINALQTLAWLQEHAGRRREARHTLQRARALIERLPTTPGTAPTIARLEALLALPLAEEAIADGDLDEAGALVDGALHRLASTAHPQSTELRAARRLKRRLEFGLAGPGAPSGSLPAASDAILGGDLGDARALLEALLADGPASSALAAGAMLGTVLAVLGEHDAAGRWLPRRR